VPPLARLQLHLLALCVVAGLAGAAQPASLQVQWIIFSGRPDPTFAVTDPVAIREVVTMVDALPRHPTLRDNDTAIRPQLGYRGFRITGLEGLAWAEVFGNTIELAVSPEGGGTLTRSFRFDENATLEAWLFQAGRAQGVLPDQPLITPPTTPPTVTVAAAGVTIADRSITIQLGGLVIPVDPPPPPAPITIASYMEGLR
jgi:hypothetical protein